jgi:hypothetical protein
MVPKLNLSTYPSPLHLSFVVREFLGNLTSLILCQNLPLVVTQKVFVIALEDFQLSVHWQRSYGACLAVLWHFSS